MYLRPIISAIFFIIGASCCWSALAADDDARFIAPQGYEMPFGPSPFAPSNAQTTTGQFISQTAFISAERCSQCHESTHAEWSESAHRNAFREPFYKANVDHLIRERGIAVTRHCESCHDPVALFSGAVSKNAKMERPFDEEGVTCTVCHSIQSVTTQGIGSYKIAPPALLELPDGRRIVNASDDDIVADLESHSRAMMRPLLKKPEFCAACHESAVPPELNGRKWSRSFSIYDEWQQSAFSGEAVQPMSVRHHDNCQTCHMPKEADSGYALHRWPGGNTSIPAHYDWPNQLKATSDLLKAGVVSVDIFALSSQKAARREVVAPLDSKTTVSAGERISVDVVVANLGVGHSFPAELRDMFEAWIEFKATDAAGKVLIHSGAVSTDGTLEWSAHAYRTVPIDDDGQPITRHDIWRTRINAIDRQIPAGRADVARFSFKVPFDARGPIKLAARLNYRHLNSRFIESVNRTNPVKPSPVVEMSAAETEFKVVGKAKGAMTIVAEVPVDDTQRASLRNRWRFYGGALFDQELYQAAAYAFKQALMLAVKGSPDEAASLVDLAMCYIQMKPIKTSRAAIANANECIARALEIAPTDGRARYYKARLNIKQGRYSEALPDLEALSHERPRDLKVWSQLASVYLLQRRDKDARIAYEHVLAIEPDDTEAHFKLLDIFRRLGLKELAQIEQKIYQARRADPAGETLKRHYLKANPDLYATWP
jgi:Tfp pilus assembly protein PilF